MTAAPPKPETFYIVACARYWLVDAAQHRIFLARVADGARVDMDLVLATITTAPVTAARVPGEARRRIPWENGGARDLDGVTPEAARAYLERPV